MPDTPANSSPTDQTPALQSCCGGLTRRLPWLPAVATGLGIGALLGAVVLWQQPPREQQVADAIAALDAGDSPTLLDDASAAAPDLDARLQRLDQRLAALHEQEDDPRDNHQRDDHGRAFPVTHGVTVQLTDGRAPLASESLPVMTAEARPITASTAARDRLLTALIDAELPGATDAERAIWIDSLAGLSIADARGVLQMRSRIGTRSLTHDWPPHTPQPLLADPAAAPLAKANSAPVEPTASPATAARRTREAWQQVADSARRNLDRQDCLGYLAEFVQLIESPDGRSVTVTPMRRHEEPGPALFTGRPLDVAVEAPGFLQVRDGDAVCLTRYGRLAIDGDTVGVALPGGFAPLHPPVTVDVCLVAGRRLRADAQDSGKLYAGEDPVATIPIWTVDDIGALGSRGRALYVATAASGDPVAHAGRMRPRHLTGSNVAPEIEAAWLADLERRLGLPQLAAPVQRSVRR